MHKRIAVITPLLLLFLACKGQSHEGAGANRVERAPAEATAEAAAPVAETAATSASKKATGLFMWEVAGERPTYLLGTFHIGVNAADIFPKLVWDKLLASDTLVLEADISTLDPASVMVRGKYPPGETLEQKLDPKEWQALVALLGEVMPPPMLTGFRPWLIQTLAVQTMSPPGPPMDPYIQQRAREAGKKFAYLEDAAFQLGLLEEVLTVDVLKDFLSDTKAQEKKLKDIAASYVAGDLRAFAAIVFDAEEMAKFPKIMELLFETRNQDWLPKFERHIATGNVFIAVGAGHLVGERGMVKLLEKKGHKVTRVVLPRPE